MKEIIKLCCFVFLTCWSQDIVGQTYKLQGEVRDASSGELLIGANVSVCGHLTATGFDGRFDLDLINEQCTLIVSYIGYELFEESVNVNLYANKDFIVFLSETTSILDQAVITASKFDQKQSTSTVTLEIINPSFIQNATRSSIDEVLDLVPGVDIIDGQANIRGGSGYSYGAGSRVLLVIDDMPALQFDGGYPNWDDVATERIERIEVLKGASSVLYGSSALNGVIHVKSQNASMVPVTKFGGFYRHYFGPKEKIRQWWTTPAPFEMNSYISHTQKVGKFDIAGSGSFTKLNSYNESTSDQRGRITTGIKYFLKPNLNFSLNTNFNFGENSSFFYWGNALRKSFQPTPSAIREASNFRFMLDPKVNFFDKKNNKHVWKARYSKTNNKSNNDQGVTSSFSYLSYNYFLNLDVINASIVSGVDYTYNTTDAPLYGDASYSGYNLAIFTQWNQKLIGEDLQANLGFRYEINQLKNSTYTYVLDEEERVVLANVSKEQKPVFRTGINYKLGLGTFFRASFGQAYRYPTIAEKFTATGFGGFNIIPNPDLESESGWSAEFGTRQEFKFGTLLGYIDAAIFQSRYNNMMEFSLSPEILGVFQSQNIGNTIISGLESSTAWQYTVGKLNLKLLLAYTYIDPKYAEFTPAIMASSTSEENILKYRYKHSFKSNFAIDLYNWEFMINQRYNSHMQAIDATFESFIPGIANFRSVYNEGYQVFSSRIGYNWKRLSLGVHIDNIFNTLYTERPGLLEAPRNISLQLDFLLK